MVQNLGEEIQRRYVVDRGESFVTQAELWSVIHGRLKPNGSRATLIVLQFKFLPLKASRRARRAKIKLKFFADELNGGNSPQVLRVAPVSTLLNKTETTITLSPEGPFTAGSLGASVGLKYEWEKTTSRESATRIQSIITFNDATHSRDSVAWVIQENPVTKSGIPTSLRTAVLLSREFDRRFFMVTEVEVDITGFSLERALLKQAPDDPVIFDPQLSLFGSLDGIDPKNLDSLDIESLAFVEVAAQSVQESHPPVGLAEIIGDSRPLAGFRARRGREDWIEVQPGDMINVESGNKISVESGNEIRVEPGDGIKTHSPAGESQEKSQEAFYVELWNDEAGNRSKGSVSEMTDDGPEFKGIPSKKWDHAPDAGLLSRDFAWFKEELDDKLQTSEEMQQLEVKNTLCSLLVRRSSSSEFSNYETLNALFNKQAVDAIVEFFDLPSDYYVFRQQDYGTCELVSTGTGIDLYQAYIMQTPFYSSGFWSLILICKADPTRPSISRKISGVIQAGADVDLKRVLSDVKKSAESCSRHPLLLPVQLFKEHLDTTSNNLRDILNKVKDVEGKLMSELDPRNKKRQLQHEGWIFGELGKTLHRCSMDLAELTRRRTFEDEIADALKKELVNHAQLLRQVTRLEGSARKHRLDIENLPDRIESQKTLLYALIAQRDNIVSIGLAKEAIRDSKAMKTLSVLTIVFLPGAFIATLFSTSMISFRDKGQEIWIYVAVVVPLTLLLLVAYVIWLQMTPSPYYHGGDVEDQKDTVSDQGSSYGDKGSKQS